MIGHVHFTAQIWQCPPRFVLFVETEDKKFYVVKSFYYDEIKTLTKTGQLQKFLEDHTLDSINTLQRGLHERRKI